MISFGEHQRNQAAYLRLKESIAAESPRGWFVAIADEKVIAAAETVLALEKLLREQGRDPRSVLAVEAGVDYPGYATILSSSAGVRGYGSNVLRAVRQDSPDFAGLAGLPLLRMLEYGGDATSFWVRKAGGTP